MGPMIPKEIKYNLHYGKVTLAKNPIVVDTLFVELVKKNQKSCLWKQKTRKRMKTGVHVW